MGVGGNFWELLKPYARREGFDFLRNKRVAVDLSFWIVQHENAMKATHVRKPHLRLTFFRTINLFSKFGVLPVFIVDGTPSPLKAQARIARYFGSCGIELTSLPVSEGVSAERSSLFSSRVQECVELVKLLGMPVLQAKGEAEALCAQLNSEGHVDACITADSDAFLFGAKCIIKCFCPNSKEPFECYNMSDIEAGLGLKRKHLIAISLLVGNDHDMNGVRGIGLDNALHFAKAFNEDDILNRLQEIGKGDTSQIPSCTKFEDNIDVDGNCPNTKQPHCSLCGHPGSKKDHMKFSCESCVTKDDEGCQRKPEGFKCDCCSCVLNRRHKEQKREENRYSKICHKIAEEPNFPKDEIIDMYLCNDNGYFSASDGPRIIWGKPNIEMLIDFLNFHQHWEPSYIRRTMFPMMSTIFLRDMSTPTGETLLFGQYEFDSVERVKMRYGYQFYVVKWKRAGVNINTSKVPSNESSVQQDVVELDEMVDLLDDAPEIHQLVQDKHDLLQTQEYIHILDSFFSIVMFRFLPLQHLVLLCKISNFADKHMAALVSERFSSSGKLKVQLMFHIVYRSSICTVLTEDIVKCHVRSHMSSLVGSTYSKSRSAKVVANIPFNIIIFLVFKV
ncbi:Flap endonuclease GEN-like 1 [Vigna angularis]|uniref:Flap endonuclease GEN-like 1 n=1 Tax=Phaseolus angularis TaxID=3914 RepID=A0A8T0L1U2_PHAAN|nr:Flap endonuclease GEN-like 1 [Vigna angularis]